MVTLNGSLPLSTAQDGRTHSQWHAAALLMKPDPGAPQTIDVGASTDVGLIVKAASGQSVNLQEWRNSSGTNLASVSPTGTITAPQITTPYVVQSATMPYLQMAQGGWFINRGAIAYVPLTVQGMASQSGDLQQWKDSAGTPVFAVTTAGLPKWSAAGNAQTTVGAAGGASALPATPIKYLKVQDSAGNTYVVPCYNP